MFYYLKHEVVSQNKYFMWFSKAIIHCAICMMHASQFAICHLAPHSFQGAQMFQAQKAPIEAAGRSHCHQVARRSNQHVNMLWIRSW